MMTMSSIQRSTDEPIDADDDDDYDDEYQNCEFYRKSKQL